MVYSLNYRRPAHVDMDSKSIDEKANSIDESIRSGNSGASHGIPDALSFDRIIEGGTCPPCTTREFMDYLIYIEHAAENLQFFLWLRDYTKRFSELPVGESALAPEWTPEQAEAEAAAAQAANAAPKKIDAETAAIFKGSDFEKGTRINAKEPNPFSTPPHTPGDMETDSIAGAVPASERASTVKSAQPSLAQKAAGAFENAELKWQPFTVQPFREEITRIIATYFAEGASRELNLSSRERTAVLHALGNTTHPTAFRGVASTIEWSLRFQAHPNFIRWTICNGNRPRVIFARGLGVSTIFLGFVAAILITLSSAGRGWRALAAIGWVIGVATLIAAWKGMCVVLHGMHHRHLRPWELFSGEDDSLADMETKKESFDSLGSSNSYEDEPWIAKYEKRNIVRKVFDREVWIQEPALRQIQDTIFLQAVCGALLAAAIFTAIFVAIPKGKVY